MINAKKTLVVKVSHDVSEMSDLALEIAKMATRIQGLSQGLRSDQIDFEVIKEETEAKPTEAEKNDAIPAHQAIIDLFNSAFGSHEDDDEDDDDEDEAVYDEE